MNQQGIPSGPPAAPSGGRATIQFQCACGQWFQAPASNAGQSGKCGCGRTLVVPAVSQAPPAAPASGMPPMAGGRIPPGRFPGAAGPAPSAPPLGASLSRGPAPSGSMRAPAPPRNTVQCPSCGEWSRPGMSCEWCSGSITPPRPSAAPAPPVGRTAPNPAEVLMRSDQAAEEGPPPPKVLALIGGCVVVVVLSLFTTAGAKPLVDGPSRMLMAAIIASMTLGAVAWVYHTFVRKLVPYILAWVLVAGCFSVVSYLKLNAVLDTRPEQVSITVVSGRHTSRGRRGRTNHYLTLSPWVNSSSYNWDVSGSMYESIQEGERLQVVTKPGRFGIRWLKAIRRPSTGQSWTG